MIIFCLLVASFNAYGAVLCFKQDNIAFGVANTFFALLNGFNALTLVLK